MSYSLVIYALLTFSAFTLKQGGGNKETGRQGGGGGRRGGESSEADCIGTKKSDLRSDIATSTSYIVMMLQPLLLVSVLVITSAKPEKYLAHLNPLKTT